MLKTILSINKLIIILSTFFSTIFFTNSASDYQSYNITVNLNMYLPYKLGEHSLRVSLLQKDLNIAVTGIYDEQTRDAHLNYLKNLNVPTNNIPQKPSTTTPAPIFTDEVICKASQARIFAHQILDPHNIPIPSITVISNAKDSFYGPGSDAIFMPPCETKSGITHEIGHYVHARAFGFKWSLAVDDAAKNFTGNDWIVAQETTPGIEHAAHCIGNVLWGRGSYTKCPDVTMRSYAEKIILQASS